MKVSNWTGEETVKVKNIVSFLNKVLELDRNFISEIFLTYFKCNRKIRDHKTIQVICYGKYSKKSPACRLIGLLNGIIGINKHNFGAISMNINLKTNKITNFELIDKKVMERYKK